MICACCVYCETEQHNRAKAAPSTWEASWARQLTFRSHVMCVSCVSQTEQHNRAKAAAPTMVVVFSQQLSLTDK